jgi:hypothetical protein
MSFFVPSSTLDKQRFKTDFAIILTGPYFQDSDIHSTIIDADVFYILALDVNI